MDVAQEAGELDGKAGPEVGKDGPGTVCDGYGLPDKARASRFLLPGPCRGGQKAVPKMVPSGARDLDLNRRTIGADGPSCPDGRGSLGGNLGSLGSKYDDRFYSNG